MAQEICDFLILINGRTTNILLFSHLSSFDCRVSGGSIARSSDVNNVSGTCVRSISRVLAIFWRFKGEKNPGPLWCFFSSPEHNVFKMIFCDHPCLLSVFKLPTQSLNNMYMYLKPFGQTWWKFTEMILWRSPTKLFMGLSKFYK